MRILKSLLAATMALLSIATFAQGQPTYPTRPITIITPFAPGNAPDVLVRGVANQMSVDTGATIVVESRPGAATFLAAQAAARAHPDGYTVLITSANTFTSNRHLFKKLPYDPEKDFLPVATLAKGPLVLVVGPSVQAQDIQSLVAFAKQHPAKLSYAEATPGTRIVTEILQRKTGTEFVRVPYKTTTHAIPDLIGGVIDLMFTDLTVLRQVKDGRLRALAIADTKRSALAPEVPTLEEGGIKDMGTLGFTLLLMTPSGTPVPIVEWLRKAMTKAMNSPELQQTFANGGTYPFNTTSEELRRLIESESKMWSEMVHLAGMKPQ